MLLATGVQISNVSVLQILKVNYRNFNHIKLVLTLRELVWA